MSKRKRKAEEAAAAIEEAGAQNDMPTASPDEERRLLPVDIQQKEFRLAFRGYNEHDVDQFLDHVTEELARLHEENKRLSERVTEGAGSSGYGGAAPGMLIEDAQRRAEEIVREAREQAASVLARAGADADGPPAVPGPDASPSQIRSFLAREREFLQGLAGLIQTHAEAVKQDAQQARAQAEAPGGATTPEPEPPDVEADQDGDPYAPPGRSSGTPPPAVVTGPSGPLPPLVPTTGSAPDREPEPGVAPEPPVAETPTPPAGDAWSTEDAEDDPWAPPATRSPERSEPDIYSAPEPAPELHAAPDSEPNRLEDTQAWMPPGDRDAPPEYDPVSEAGPETPRGGASPPPSWAGTLPSDAPDGLSRPATEPASGAAMPPQPPGARPAPTPPARPGEPKSLPEDRGREEDDRSLRELFWGEE